MMQHSETMAMPVTQRLRRRAHAFAWLLVTSVCASASMGACGLDPVASTDLCKGPGPLSENCAQCQVMPFAPECGQCWQSGADPEMCRSPTLPNDEPGGTGGDDTGGGTGGVGAAGRPTAGMPNAGAAHTAGEGGNAMAGQGTPGPACSRNADCHAPTPACHPSTQKCVDCLDDTLCSASQKVCDGLKNRCVDCLRDDDCGKCPGGGDACRPKENGTCGSDYRCVDCDGNRGCSMDKPVCLDRSCVECSDDADCAAGPSGAKRVCTAEHRCVGCSSNADCAAPTPLCDTAATHTCLGCLSNTDCAAPTPVCDAAGTHTCLGCLSNTDCAAPTPVCDAAGTHTCLGCLSNADCGGATPLCDAAGTHTCVGCLGKDDCSGATPLCDAAGTRTCVGCLSNGDCRAPTPACAAEGHECVECQVADDCPKVTAARCVLRYCESCTSDDDCKHFEDTPFCATGAKSGACIQCRSDADCGSGTCDFTTFQCSATRPHTVADCLPCGSDSQCFDSSRCIPRSTAKYPGTFCFPLARGASCSGPLPTRMQGMPTTDMQGLVDVCVTPATISCKAVRATLDRLSCSNDQTCGESPTDGTCRNSQCTYYCGDKAECSPGLRCDVWCQP